MPEDSRLTSPSAAAKLVQLRWGLMHGMVYTSTPPTKSFYFLSLLDESVY